MFLRTWGLLYRPIDGHNVKQFIRPADRKQDEKAVVVHVITKKGRIYAAENNPANFMDIAVLHRQRGAGGECNGASYTQVFASSLVRLARQNEKIVAITAAMPYGTGLVPLRSISPTGF